MQAGSKSAGGASEKRGRGRPARPALDTQETRDGLLEAAIRLFARHGFEAVSTGDIAKAAGLTQSMVHYHFGSKDKIWRAAVTRLMRRRGPMFAPTRLEHAPLDPVAKLELLIRNLAAANAAEPDYARIVMQESIADSDRLQWLIEEFIAPGFKVFDDAIREAQERGLIRDLPLHDLTNIVTSTVSLTFSLGPLVQKLYDVDMGSEGYLSSLSSSIVDVLFAGLKTRP
ncbi:TetR/AcrR family transcriptional regulator [Novosphingobium sp. PS1R-30]|uniref:TetR/AcrR family transcriptional regulator n=1 Tax=Novosphingobium anseongense TaxID=3133436 RepID=A0ABU8S1E6_9SPHN